MSNDKPWTETWEARGRSVYRDDDGLPVYVASAVSGDAKTVFAVARIIAAAPELYRALLEAYPNMGNPEVEEHLASLHAIFPADAAKYERARAAIRKARGE